MPEPINAEKCHIGRALIAHREAFALTLADLIANTAPGEDNYLRWTERAARPSVLRLNWWHFLFTEALANADPPRVGPVGMREQWWTNEHDDALWHQAKNNRRTVSWWWNPRRTGDGYGAMCYVCQRLIVPFDASRPVTPPVRVAVMEHRAAHITNTAPPMRDEREKVGH